MLSPATVVVVSHTSTHLGPWLRPHQLLSAWNEPVNVIAPYGRLPTTLPSRNEALP